MLDRENLYRFHVNVSLKYLDIEIMYGSKFNIETKSQN